MKQLIKRSKAEERGDILVMGVIFVLPLIAVALLVVQTSIHVRQYQLAVGVANRAARCATTIDEQYLRDSEDGIDFNGIPGLLDAAKVKANVCAAGRPDITYIDAVVNASDPEAIDVIVAYKYPSYFPGFEAGDGTVTGTSSVYHS